MASLQVDAAPVEEVKSQAEPTTNVSSYFKETEGHELDEEKLEINFDEGEEEEEEEEEEKEKESLVTKYSPLTSVEHPSRDTEFEADEDEDKEDDKNVYKV